MSAAAVDEALQVLQRLRARGEDHVWLYRPSDDALLAQARALDERRRRGDAMPLHGLSFGVKDNIDVEGWPTTAGCEAFRYVARRSAAVVEKLQAAGALLVGKQNLDQFATGLVGVRTTGAHPANAVHARYVPGGSSSGSAVAVAAGVVSFSIGSDTGGSGRVPAALNGIVGLKPTPGAVSTRGFVYCNRSFDVPPVFARRVDEAYRVLQAIVGFDAEDAYADPDAPPDVSAWRPATLPPRWRFAVPRADQLEFFGDAAQRDAFDRALQSLRALGGSAVEIDFGPFAEAGRMVFDSPLVAERWVSYGAMAEQHPEALHPAVLKALAAARSWTADDAFRTLYRLRALQRDVRAAIERAGGLFVTPTVPTLPTVAQVQAEPMAANTRMGHYTYFANPLRLATISVPAWRRSDGLPFGLSISAPSFGEARIGAVARALEESIA